MAGGAVIVAMLPSLGVKYFAAQWLVAQGAQESVGLLTLVDGVAAVLAFLYSYRRVKRG